MLSLNLPVIVLLSVFLLIALRGVLSVRITIWQAMVGGAVVVLLSGDITPYAAWAAIDWEVMVFLFGMFVVGQALVQSGFLYQLAYGLFSRTRSTDALVLMLLFGAGLGSALLMNDTLAIIGTPLVLRLAHEHKLDARLLLLALAFAVTTGSVLSPIGNPQNLLIATQISLASPFVTFLEHLALPTLINLVMIYLLLRVMFRHEFHTTPLVHTPVTLIDPLLARWVKLSLVIIVLLIMLRMLLVNTGGMSEFRLSYIALAGAAPLLLFSARRGELVRRLDWQTLAFFLGLFVLMAAVWESGFFQRGLVDYAIDITAPVPLLLIPVALSQLISNVPLVALYLPLLGQAGAGVPDFMVLAAASTIAGNLLILGAASNVIIVQSAERHGSQLGFFTFARIGIPLTLLQLWVYWLFL
ncbi:MAG: anion transporter [Gammaproteobacteria bacterium]|nr:anion transporter [Gammaproteobacteria bacterium]